MFFGVFGFNYSIGISGEFAEESVGGGVGVDAQPMLGRFVVGISDTVVLFTELGNALGLAFERDDVEVVAVEKREHMSRHVEDEDAFAILELGKGQFLLDIRAEREAEFAIIFNVHWLQHFRWTRHPVRDNGPAQLFEAAKLANFPDMCKRERKKVHFSVHFFAKTLAYMKKKVVTLHPIWCGFAVPEVASVLCAPA